MNDCIRNTTPRINELYEVCKPVLFNIGLRLGYTREELKDLINQFFLDMLEKKIDFSSVSNPQAYLVTAFKRKLIDYYRNNKQRLHAGKMYVVESDYEPSIQEAMEKLQCNTELIDKIKAAYEKLPARCRKVIFLKYYEGACTEKIAEQTGLSKRTVYNNLFTGISLLRSQLETVGHGVAPASLITLLIILLTIC